MLETVYIILILAAIVLLILSSQTEDQLWAFVFIMVSGVLWFVVAASGMEVEVPYSMFNATSGQIESGTQIVTSKVSPYLTYLFGGIGAVCVVISLYQVFDIISTVIGRALNRRGQRR